MKKVLIALGIINTIIAIVSTSVLIYVLNLTYYDNYYCDGVYYPGEEEKISTLVVRILEEI